MKSNVEVLFDITVKSFDEQYLTTIKNVVHESLIYENIKGNFEVSVSVVSNDEIRKINLEHRGFDKATDVLSFPLVDNFKSINPKLYYSLGDIIISLDKAIEQSLEYNHSLNREIAFLTAHSMLHLLGYDHITKEEEKEMFLKQEKILYKLNYTRS